MNIDKYTKNLKNINGIWYADKKRELSYMEGGNDMCYQVEDNSFWFNHRNKCIIELVKKYSPGRLFFDVGGGNGFVSKGIESIGTETVLVEPGEQGCINAQKRKLPNIICSTLEDAGFDKDSIPSIGVFDVVEHIKDDVGILKSIHSYLEKDGLVYITVPAYNMLWSEEDNVGGHFYRYTLASLSDKLKKAGFENVFATYIFSVLPLPIFLMRTIPSKLGFKKKSYSATENQNEHRSPGLLDKVWAWELERMKKGKPISFGGSCLVVARKV